MARRKPRYFRKRLRDWMDELEISPNDLAHYSRFTASYIYAILAGQKLPSLNAAIRIVTIVERRMKRGSDPYIVSPPNDCLDLMDSYLRDYFSSDSETKKATKMAEESGIFSRYF